MEHNPNVIFNDTTKSSVCQDIIKHQLNILNQKKIEQEKISPFIEEAWKKNNLFTQEKKQRLNDCGTFVSFNSNGEMSGANFCRDKLCPICQWRKSRKVFGEIMQIQKIVEKQVQNFALLTLTLKNTEHLEKGITEILKGFYNFSNNRTFKKISLGYIRTLEITFNTKNKNWHPHIHLIIALKDSYYSGNYITTQKWSEIWKACAKIDYEPIIDIRAIGKAETVREKAVAEVAKYAVKPFQTKGSPSDELKAYEGLYGGTAHRRLRSYGGIYAKARKDVPEQKEPLDLTAELLFRRKKGTYELYSVFNATN